MPKKKSPEKEPEQEIEIDPEHLERHPLSAIFDDLQGEEFQELKDSIRETGLQHPIIIDSNGYVVDGWQRFRAIQSLRDEGHEDIHEEFEILSENDPTPIVAAFNLARRSMTPMERAQAVIEMDKWRVENIAGAKPMTIKKAAEVADVSQKTVQRARAAEQQSFDTEETTSRASDDEVSEETTTVRRSRIEELEEELIVERQEHRATKTALAQAEERIAFMEEGGTESSMTFIGMQKRLEAAHETVDTQKRRIASLEAQVRTLKKQAG